MVNSSSKRILLIAPQPFFTNRGTPLNVKAMAEVLGRRGYQIDLLVYPFGDDLSISNVRILRTRRLPFVRSVPIGPSIRKLIFDISLSIQATILSFRNRYDLIHGVEEGAIIAGIIGAWRKVPHIADIDCWMADQLGGSCLARVPFLARTFTFLEYFFLRRACGVIAVCRVLAERVRNVAPGVPVFQIEDFVSETIVEDLEGKVDILRKQYAPHGEKIIIYTGNFEDYQGLPLLIKAFALLQKELQDSGISVLPRLVLVGGEPDHIRDLEELVSSLELKGKVIFCGKKPLTEIPTFLKMADTLVSPRKEGVNTPLKIYDYMNSDRPIVASNIVSHTQVLDNENSYLADPEPQDFARALKEALDDSLIGQEIRQKRTYNAKRIAQASYTYKAFEKKLVDAYNSVFSSLKDPD